MYRLANSVEMTYDNMNASVMSLCETLTTILMQKYIVNLLLPANSSFINKVTLFALNNLTHSLPYVSSRQCWKDCIRWIFIEPLLLIPSTLNNFYIKTFFVQLLAQFSELEGSRKCKLMATRLQLPGINLASNLLQWHERHWLRSLIEPWPGSYFAYNPTSECETKSPRSHTTSCQPKKKYMILFCRSLKQSAIKVN